MAFPASQQRLADALEEASKIALDVRKLTQSVRDQSAAGDTDRTQFVGLMRTLAKAIERWGAISSLSGITAYAQEQYGDATLDVAAEFNAMASEAASLREWIHTNFPKAPSGAWEVVSYGLDGSFTNLKFSTAQTAEFRTRADALIAAIG